METLTAPGERPDSGASGLMERVVSRPNLRAAYQRVRANKGSPGIDGLTVEELPAWLREHGERVRGELLAGTYPPTPVRRQTIPKPGGGERTRRYGVRKGTSRGVVAGWWTWTWNGFSTG